MFFFIYILIINIYIYKYIYKVLSHLLSLRKWQGPFGTRYRSFRNYVLQGTFSFIIIYHIQLLWLSAETIMTPDTALRNREARKISHPSAYSAAQDFNINLNLKIGAR